jgi:hypothetical protein
MAECFHEWPATDRIVVSHLSLTGEEKNGPHERKVANTPEKAIRAAQF